MVVEQPLVFSTLLRYDVLDGVWEETYRLPLAPNQVRAARAAREEAAAAAGEDINWPGLRDGDVAVAQLGENGMSLALHLCALIADRAVPLGSAAFTIQKLCTPPALGRERPTSVSAPAELPHFDAAELAGGEVVVDPIAPHRTTTAPA